MNQFESFAHHIATRDARIAELEQRLATYDDMRKRELILETNISALTASMAALERENERLKAQNEALQLRTKAHASRIADCAGCDALRGRVEEARELLARALPFAKVEGRKTWAIDCDAWLSTLPAPIPGEPVSKSVAKRIAAQKVESAIPGERGET